MLKTNIYASSITNLSDARYFAAYGVTYLGFRWNKFMSWESIKTMARWVEGVQIVIEFEDYKSYSDNKDEVVSSGIQSIRILNNIENKKVDSDSFLVSCDIYDTPHPYGEIVLKINKEYSEINTSMLREIEYWCQINKTWLELPTYSKSIGSLVEATNPYGIVVHGGDEERTGIRDYDQLDSMMEHLIQ